MNCCDRFDQQVLWGVTMIRDLEIDVLRAFVAVADTGGFTRAARRLNRTQSAISMRVRRLEEFLGKKVLHRNGGGAQLTSDGEVLLRHARRMLELNEVAVSELIRPEVEGVVRLAITDGYGTYFLPKLLADFAESHPRVQLEIDCYMSGEIEDALSNGELDLGLIVQDVYDEFTEPLWSEPIVWVASDKHTTFGDKVVPLALFQHGCVLRAQALKTLDACGQEWRIAFCSSSLAGVQAAVIAGLGVGVIGQSTVLDGMQVLGPNAPFSPLQPSEIALRRTSSELSPAARHLADHIAETLGRNSAAFAGMHVS
jgi:DNA-binding transcriptional LysR family regulator